jgi:hypothetical protein
MLGLLCAALALSAGCRSAGGQGAGVELLTAPAPGEATFSDYQPEIPYSEEIPGCLTRTVYEADSGEGYRILIRDLLVGPGKSAAGISLPGAAVLEVRSGSGSLVLGGETVKLATGSTVEVAAGQPIDLENASQIALTIRAFILIAT